MTGARVSRASAIRVGNIPDMFAMRFSSEVGCDLPTIDRFGRPSGSTCVTGSTCNPSSPEAAVPFSEFGARAPSGAAVAEPPYSQLPQLLQKVRNAWRFL